MVFFVGFPFSKWNGGWEGAARYVSRRTVINRQWEARTGAIIGKWIDLGERKKKENTVDENGLGLSGLDSFKMAVTWCWTWAALWKELYKGLKKRVPEKVEQCVYKKRSSTCAIANWDDSPRSVETILENLYKGALYLSAWISPSFDHQRSRIIANLTHGLDPKPSLFRWEAYESPVLKGYNGDPNILVKFHS